MFHLKLTYNLKCLRTCLSLGTRTNAYILHNPPLNKERPLKDWYAANSTHVTELLNARVYRDTTLLFRPPTAAEIIPLNIVVQSIENRECEHFPKFEGIVVEASIKSPDTNKLIQYTANELKVAAEKTLLTKEVEAALEKTSVLCFLKYYDRTTRGSTVRRYPILKVYTEIEAESYHQAQEQTQQHVPLEPSPDAAPTDAQAVQQIGSSSFVQTKNSESEFFTPTTKKILEDVYQVHHIEKTHDGSASNTKRTMSFDEAKTNKEPSISTLQPIGNATAAKEPVLPPDGLPQNPVTLSPSKKLKGKKNTA